jgi:hypothetical protein
MHRTWRQSPHCNAIAASVSAIRSTAADMQLGVSRVGTFTSLVNARPLRDSLIAAAAGATTRQTTGAVLNG